VGYVFSRIFLLFSDDDKLNDIYDTYRQLTFKDAINRDERRFKAADLNKDWKFTKDEYGAFVHPENVPHMKDIVIEVSNDIISSMDVSFCESCVVNLDCNSKKCRGNQFVK